MSSFVFKRTILEDILKGPVSSGHDILLSSGSWPLAFPLDQFLVYNKPCGTPDLSMPFYVGYERLIEIWLKNLNQKI